MSSIRVRVAEERDLPAIESLMRELIESVDDSEGLDPGMIYKNYLALLRNGDSHILVAEVDGSIIGTISFTTRKTIMHPASSGLIDEIVVTKSYRGKGAGKKLIYAAVEKCEQLGCREVEVSTEFTNDNAREFYKSCGFLERGVLLEKEI